MEEGFQREAMSGTVSGFEDRLAAVFGRTPGASGTNRLELRRAGDNTAAITRVLCDGRRTGSVRHDTHHLLVFISDGSATITDNDATTVVAQPGAPVMLSAGTEYGYDITATKLTLLQISAAFVRARAAQRGTVIGAHAVLQQPMTQATRRAVTALIPTFGTELASPQTDPATRIDIANTIADALLQTSLPAGAGGELTGHVAAAEAWIRPRLREDISASDIASGIGISVRTLQQSFQAELGLTPTAYLRTQRLERVREELLDPAENVTVNSVAREWGFHHAGRFSSAYNDRFGELPRITLAHSKRRTEYSAAH